jgi:hypothetical protein
VATPCLGCGAFGNSYNHEGGGSLSIFRSRGADPGPAVESAAHPEPGSVGRGAPRESRNPTPSLKYYPGKHLK